MPGEKEPAGVFPNVLACASQDPALVLPTSVKRAFGGSAGPTQIVSTIFDDGSHGAAQQD